MKQLILPLIAMLFSFNSQAMYGQVNVDDVPDSFCRLLIYNGDASLRSICSGTLVSETEVATAGHCVDPMKEKGARMQVDCGYTSRNGYKMKTERTRKGTKVFTEGVYFKETQFASVFYIHTEYPKQTWGDAGRVILPQPSKLTPAAVLPYEELLRWGRIAAQQYAPPFEKCMAGGYGVMQGDVAGYPLIGEYGEIYFMDNVLMKMIDIQGVPEDQKAQFLKAQKAENTVRAFSRFLADFNYIPASIDAGDSGGGLLCEVDGQWQLVGITTDYKMHVAPGAFLLNYQQIWNPYDPSQIKKLVVPLED